MSRYRWTCRLPIALKLVFECTKQTLQSPVRARGTTATQTSRHHHHQARACKCRRRLDYYSINLTPHTVFTGTAQHTHMQAANIRHACGLSLDPSHQIMASYLLFITTTRPCLCTCCGLFDQQLLQVQAGAAAAASPADSEALSGPALKTKMQALALINHVWFGNCCVNFFFSERKIQGQNFLPLLRRDTEDHAPSLGSCC